MMEIHLLFPIPRGEPRPRAVEMTFIPDEEPFAWAAGKIGEHLANVFDQNMSKLPHVQTGTKSMRDVMMKLGHYQDIRVRHYQTTLRTKAEKSDQSNTPALTSPPARDQR